MISLSPVIKNDFLVFKFLFLIDNLFSVTDSPVPISNPIDYYAGQEYNLGCSLQYGSPIAEQAEERLPVIRASVGNRVVAVENATIDRQNGDPGVEASSYSLVSVT